MLHLCDLDSLSLSACQLTIGSYDGVHLGHQRIIALMTAEAQRLKMPSVVLTFYPHPAIVLNGPQGAFYLTSPEEKAALLGGYGIDYVVTVRFNLELSQIRAGDFLNWLNVRLQFNDLWTGANFAFGYHREGNIQYLSKASAERCFGLHVVPPVVDGEEMISSSKIREALGTGDLARVKRFLHRPFILSGTVIPGAGRGHRLGFPTANLSIWREHAYPSSGVYACGATVDDNSFDAVVNIGVRPTFNDGHKDLVIEAHLLDFDGDLYQKQIELAFIERIRDEKRFANLDDLREQISSDVRYARAILAEVSMKQGQKIR
jgi:riboflavin kinase/FMN adenylyltransferase